MSTISLLKETELTFQSFKQNTKHFHGINDLETNHAHGLFLTLQGSTLRTTQLLGAGRHACRANPSPWFSCPTGEGDFFLISSVSLSFSPLPNFVSSLSFSIQYCKIILFSPLIAREPWVIFLENFTNITKNTLFDWLTLLAGLLIKKFYCSLSEEKLSSHLCHAVFQAWRPNVLFFWPFKIYKVVSVNLETGRMISSIGNFLL